ncbi:MAG: hypothetical protein IK095_09965, partial [Oscillospiraceae bacterium]|nr:hypothetical protein [Oscillospiraceae bacterium]
MKRGKRLLSLLLALTMMFSLFSMGGISAFAEEEGTIAPVEEPVPEGEGSIAPADGTETDAVPAPGAEPEAGGYAVGYQIDTYDANGNLSQFLIGGTVTLSKTSAADGEKVSCIVRPNSGYRLAQVMFGSEGQEPDEDVTDSLQGTMKARDMVFFVKFVAEGGTIESAGAALRIDAPGLGGSYPGGVPVSTTKYYSFPQVIAAPSSFHVENAFWRIRYGGDPTTILAGNTYYADFDLVPNDCFRFVEGFMPVVELTMPDGTVHDDGFTVTRNADGSLHVKSPDYTVPGSTDYHYLFGRVLTYDRNGNYDASLTGGTITVSTATARAGDTVSCTVSANPGYRLLMVLLAMDQDEPVEDVTETLQGTMRDYDMEFRACFIQD